MPKGRRPRGDTPRPRSGAVAESARLRWGRNGREELPNIQGRGSYPVPEFRSGSQECQAATAQEQPRVATPRPGSGAVAESSYPTSSSQEELPHAQGTVAAQVQEGLEESLHVQGQEGWL